jgi:transcriptional regulator with XRE-family HTH domain
MIIGDRLKELREKKQLSQGDIEKRSGLLRCYLSRVEHGHTVPSVETLEKIARALKVPFYEIFFEGEGTPVKLQLAMTSTSETEMTESDGEVRKFAKHFARMNDRQRKILLAMAQRMASR